MTSPKCFRLPSVVVSIAMEVPGAVWGQDETPTRLSTQNRTGDSQRHRLPSFAARQWLGTQRLPRRRLQRNAATVDAYPAQALTLLSRSLAGQRNTPRLRQDSQLTSCSFTGNEKKEEP